MSMEHDPTRQGLCGCERCDLTRLASLAHSRAVSAAQQAAWSPRSAPLRLAAALAAAEATEARRRLVRCTVAGD